MSTQGFARRVRQSVAAGACGLLWASVPESSARADAPFASTSTPVSTPASLPASTPASGLYDRLDRGETVTYEQTIDGQSHRYVGGVTYTAIEGQASDVMKLLEDVRAYKSLLPRTKSARLVGQNGKDFWVELRQGTDVVQTSYTLRIRPDGDGRTVRFWLDATKPHGIDDAVGFFRVVPFPSAPSTPLGSTPRALLTYGVLVDLGPGIVRELFEERLRAVVLTVPQLVRRYAQRAAESARRVGFSG